MDIEQAFTTQDVFAAEYRVAISQAEAVTGTRRTIRFYGSDGRERVVDVVVPAGSVTGSRVRVVAADGNPSWGEVVAVVTVLPHQRWETRGDDLLLYLQVDRRSALREGTLQIPIGGGRTIAVPVNGELPHARYIYAGYGMPRSYNTQRNGDLVVQLELIDLPDPNAPSAPASSERNWWRTLFGSRTN